MGATVVTHFFIVQDIDEYRLFSEALFAARANMVVLLFN